MVIVKIIGGLGNQMFQYAYAKALQQKGYEVKIDTSAFEIYGLHQYGLDKYNIDLGISSKEENNEFYTNNFLNKILKKFRIFNLKFIKEKNLLFERKLLEIENDKYIDGYFQCEKYFINIREILIKQFVIKQEISNYSKEIKNKIENSKNSCSLHIRRGDFVNSINITIHGTCSLEYYKNAIKYFKEKVENISYFIFSDDIKWVKENLFIENAIYIESKESRIPHEDIYLMSLCNHNVIANSSFSWWGAWLNASEDKIVIAPKRWFANDKMDKQSKDIVCGSWVKI